MWLFYASHFFKKHIHSVWHDFQNACILLTRIIILDTWCSMQLVPGRPFWFKISSLTEWMLSSVLTLFELPLLGQRASLPVSQSFLKNWITADFFQYWLGYSFKIWFTSSLSPFPFQRDLLKTLHSQSHFSQELFGGKKKVKSLKYYLTCWQNTAMLELCKHSFR